MQESTHQLDVQVYQTRAHGVTTVDVRNALRDVHTAVLDHMRTACYVDVYRKSVQHADEPLRALIQPPSVETQTNMERVELALRTAQELAAKITALGDADVKVTSSQRAFMQSFYTLQLRSLNATWKCLVWLALESTKMLADCRAEMKSVQARCKRWRRAWNEVMQPPTPVTTESPQDVVRGWCSMNPVDKMDECAKFAAQANMLEQSMAGCVSSVQAAQAQFDSASGLHLPHIEWLKNEEIAKLNRHVVPVEAEVLWLKNYLAHVRDLLSSHPELNLFL